MSCISNNFSSFFLDSLNDPSEFAKYLGNAPENKSQTFDEQIYCNGNNSFQNIHINNNSHNIISSSNNMIDIEEGNVTPAAPAIITEVAGGGVQIGCANSNISGIGGGPSVIGVGSSIVVSGGNLSNVVANPGIGVGGIISNGSGTQIINNINSVVGNVQCFNNANSNTIVNCCNDSDNIPLSIYNHNSNSNNSINIHNNNSNNNNTNIETNNLTITNTGSFFLHHQHNQQQTTTTTTPISSQIYQQQQIHHSHQQQQQQQQQQQHNHHRHHHQQQHQQHHEANSLNNQINPVNFDSTPAKRRLNYHHQHHNQQQQQQQPQVQHPQPQLPQPPPQLLIQQTQSQPQLHNNKINNKIININKHNNNNNNNKSKNKKNTLVDIENFDHDTKHIFDIHNSNESTGTGSSLLSDQIRSSNTSECSDNSNQTNNLNINNNNNNTNANNKNNNNSNASKPLSKFVIKENFDVHPAHKVEEGIFQHMNKLPAKKKETLKQLSVTFTGHMSISEKSIIVDNFTRFCEEYCITDHRPFLTLNQSGMQKPEQIKFARYLGQGLPGFTLFCIYSNFKNLFCTKRFENYSKGSYNLQYILDKTKRFLTCTTADLKNLTPILCEHSDLPINNNGLIKQENCKVLERLTIFENFEVHESHRIEDGIFTHISRLSSKKQELLKQFGIQSNHNVSYYEKHIIIENFVRFCNEYYITDHRPFLDFHESGLPKMEQIKFARYLGQGLPNLTLYKIYSAYKDLLALNRIEKFTNDGYNLDIILKKKKKNLLNRMTSAASKELAEASKHVKLENHSS